MDEGEKLQDVLGSTIIGAKVLSSSIEGDDQKAVKVKANVEFEIHIWYRTDNDTKVSRTSVKSSDIIEIEKQGAERFKHEKVSVWIKEMPKCVDTAIIREKVVDLVEVQLEYALGAEIIGETLLNVKVFKT
jgi:hypothetical protein